MSQSFAVSCRVTFRPVSVETLSEHTSSSNPYPPQRARWDPPASETGALELRIYLPGGEWPLRVDQAKVTWGYWNAFTVEFLRMPDTDQRRWRDYLATAALLGTA